ncbi:SDR family oxidoreductase [Microlunatus elymi]|uniref:SDR family oxidoreductase n=1 Tax=Microlunatus elymi TaxID=2596828 RepID=A0A516PW06_9ACTN|nr:SDR family oxidoreductase [Microlunatus elymi]QDP95364.1 SDR family oxidoreductase [Microlunatus elymi]
MRLDDRVCLVTGAAAGIGEAIATRLATEGATVGLADRDLDKATLVADRIGGSAWRADVSQSADVAQFVGEAAERFGRIDAIVNNAGIAVGGTVADTTEDDWQRVLSTNLTGVWRGMKYALPHLIQSKGCIVNLSSVQALVGMPGWAAYAATKGAIIALTQQAAVEYGADGVRVNCLAPGTIMTPMNEQIFAHASDPDALIASWNASHALGRFGRPSEVAAAAAYLISDDASFVTGSCLRVDGGLSILGPTGRAD